MKLIKEHINEKFEEDSDPIRDMGIGNMDIIVEDIIKPILDEYKKEDQNGPRIKRKYFKKIKDVISPIIVGRYVKGSMWEMGGGRYKPRSFIIKVTRILAPGTILKDTRSHGSLYFTVGASNGKRYCLYISNKYFVSSQLTGKIYEKFEQESDPIEDMRIGNKWKEGLALKFLNWVNNDFQMDHNSSYYWGYINVSIIGLRDEDLREGFIEYVKNWPKYRKVLKELNIKISGIPDILKTIFERPEDYDSTK